MLYVLADESSDKSKRMKRPFTDKHALQQSREGIFHVTFLCFYARHNLYFR